jgi:hypothetical protein
MSLLETTVIRKLERRSEAAVALCADARLFPLAWAVACRLTRLADGAYDVHLFTEPSLQLAELPAEYPIGIELPAFLNLLPATIRHDRFRSFSSLRLLVLEILASRYQRVLYLDCDIRVESSIAALIKLDLGGAPLAAVDDYTLPHLPHDNPRRNDRIRRRRREIGHSAAEPYFNAGVMLIDAGLWRSGETTKAALALLARLDAVGANDQEILNVLFRGRWTALSPRWNFTFFHDLGFEPALRPLIYHYAGAKPWELRWDRDSSHVRAIAELFVDAPLPDFLRRNPTLADYRRALIKTAKWGLRHRCRFPRPAEIARCMRDARAPRMREAFASYLTANIRARRFLDVRAGITALDESEVRQALRAV